MIIKKVNGIAGLIRAVLFIVLAAILLTVLLAENVYAERIYGVPASEYNEDSSDETTAADSDDCEINMGENPEADMTAPVEKTTPTEKVVINGVSNTGYVGSYGNVYVSGDALVWKTYQYLIQQGFSPASACGILGNIQRESAFSPEEGSLNGVYGLFQVKDGCLQTIMDYCSAHGLSYTSGTAQVEAMVQKLAPELFQTFTGHNKVYDWNRRQEVNDGSNHYGEAGYCWWYDSMTLEDYKRIDDPEYAAEVWRRIIERNTGSASDIAKRGSFAKKFYEQYAGINTDASDIISVASQYVGNPYVWGGNSLTDGIDCSHFVCQILTMTGHYDGVYRNSGSLRSAGVPVASLEEAMPGDVLCYLGHVAFYVDENTILHAANRNRGIVIDSNVNIRWTHGGLLAIRRFR